MASPAAAGGVAARARAWRDSTHLEICDVIEPWAYGTVRRATRYPSHFDFNAVLVERDPAMSVEELVAFADRALAGLAHRRIVEHVAHDSVYDLRAAWHHADFPTEDFAAHYPDAREVALRRGAQVLAVSEAGRPIAFAQIARDADTAEITQVYVHPDYRGGGRGTALTRAAIAASGDAHDLWIVADDEDRPKQRYARLGFQPAWTTMEFLRLPEQRS